jgi:hypothetical protein
MKRSFSTFLIGCLLMTAAGVLVAVAFGMPPSRGIWLGMAANFVRLALA